MSDQPVDLTPKISHDDNACAVTLSREQIDAHLASPLFTPASHFRPVYEAVRDSGLAYAMVLSGHRQYRRPKKLRGQPLLLIVGDDLDVAQGPTAFNEKILKWVLRGAASVIIHAAAPKAAHYAGAVKIALLFQKSVLIETRPSHEVEWLKFVGRHAPEIPNLVITPNSAQWQNEAGTA